MGMDLEGNPSLVIYALGVAAGATAMAPSALAWTAYALVAIMWLIPDSRIERMLREHAEAGH